MGEPTSRTGAEFVDTLTLQPWAKLSLVGAGLLVLGSFQPWITLDVSETVATTLGVPTEETAGGLGGDGVTTLFFALVIAGVVLFYAARSESGPGLRTAGLSLFSGLVVAIVAYAVYADARATQDGYAAAEIEGTVSLELHASLFVVALGAIVLVASGAIGIKREWTTPEE
ncbi:hypothetical protein [Halovivax gelatinilyticus]|uniref:hypothetical protein n=1 Tax=Halovivax gelatinilyticus TaxID=2961597 RepID=UPI0020CA8893|nr:hypothetical protein [Halovivax gelatinilyticus]